jgi:PAS domain S-box-containing protein
LARGAGLAYTERRAFLAQETAVQNRVAWSLALAVAALLAIAALAGWNVYRIRQNDRAVAHSHAVLAALNNLLSTMKDAETGQRGYLLTGRKDYLRPYEEATAEVRRRLDDLRTLGTPDEGRQRVEAVEADVEAKLSELAQAIAAYDRQGPEAGRAVVRTDRGKQAMDRLRAAVEQAREQELALLQQRGRSSRESALIAFLSLGAGVGLGLGLLGLAYRLVRREMAVRQQAAEQVRQQREWLEVTLLGIGDAVIATDAAGRVLLLNPVAQALTGWGRDEAAGRPVEEVFHIVNEQTRAPAESPVARVIREGVVVGLANHTLLLARDGREVPVDDSGGPIRNAKGEVIGAVLVFRDVSGRRRAEAERAALLERLEAERAFLEAVLQQMPGGVVIAEGGTGKILLRNERGALPTSDEVPPPARLEDYGRFQNLFPDPRYPTFERWPLLRALRGGEVVTGEEMTYRRADGSLGTIRANAAPVRDRAGRTLAAVTTFFDVTEARRAEDAVRFLAEAGAVLGAALDYEATLADLARLVVPRLADWCSVHVVDEDGTSRQLAVAHVDPAKVEMARDLARRYPPDPDAPTGIPALLRTGKSSLVPEITEEMLERAARDADHLAIVRGLGLRSYMAVPLLARGRVLGALAFVAAESGRRYGPDDLALAEELGRRGGLAVDNARLYREAREADRRKDEFLAMLSHELRNPLAPIRNAVAVLRLRGADAETVAWAREIVERQSAHLARLVDDLLDASRLTRRKVRLRQERLDLGALVRTTCDDHRGDLEAAGLALEVEAPAGPVWVSGDRTRLAQVLGNLLANAAKFTDRGGRATVRLAAAGDRAAVAVSDTGVGVDPAMLPRLFEAFSQADRSLERSQGGLGLGLALVKGLVELHGGGVRADSAGPGRGATFTFWLPLDAEPPAAPTPRPDGEAAAPARRRVLIVEDNVDAADSLRMLLEMAGHEVAVAYTGVAGLEAARARRPDVVLCDLGLPGLTGYEVARALRQGVETAGVRLIAVSGYGRDEDQRRARESGFDEVLVKPVSPAVLERLLA